MKGVRVGHVTPIERDIRTGVTAALEATEEAVYNSLLRATTMTGNGHTVEAIPIDRVREILARHKLAQL